MRTHGKRTAYLLPVRSQPSVAKKRHKKAPASVKRLAVGEHVPAQIA